MVFAEVETEVAMVVSSGGLVECLESLRVADISFANATRRHDVHKDYWFLPSFRPAHREYRAARAELPETYEFVVDADVRRYFPSLHLREAARAVMRLTELERPDFDVGFRFLSELAPTSNYLPVGPTLASVVGTALLTPVDRRLKDETDEHGAVRWVDDITFGVNSESQAWEALRSLSSGPLKDLGVRWHPVKTRVRRAEHWAPSEPSFVDEDFDGLLEPGEAPPGGGLLTRRQVRAELSRLGEIILDDESRALWIAERLDGMLSDGSKVVRTISDLAPSKQVGDASCISLSRAARTAYSDSAAEALIDLSLAKFPVSVSGRDRLVSMAAAHDVDARVRAASAWFLATSDAFDQGVLEAIDSLPPYGRRAVLAAAAMVGESPTVQEVAKAIN